MSNHSRDESTSSAAFMDNSERSCVSFSTVAFHEHAMILGDNPATTHGPSLEIDWVEMGHSVVDLDEYETLRSPRRVKNQLLMPGYMREEVLLGGGYTRNQINAQLKRTEQERRGSPMRSLKKFPGRIFSKTRYSVSRTVSGGRQSADI